MRSNIFLRGKFRVSSTPATAARLIPTRRCYREDAVLTVSNATAEQIQDGIARINIYVPDLDNGSGRPVPDKERLIALSELDEQIIDVLNGADTDYEFDLAKGTETINAEAIKQHFVNITIEFNHVTFN